MRTVLYNVQGFERRILVRKKNAGNRTGQGMTEYILIVALVAVLTITVVTLFGNQIRAMFGYSTKQLSGDSSATMTDFGGAVDGEIDKGLDDTK